MAADLQKCHIDNQKSKEFTVLDYHAIFAQCIYGRISSTCQGQW
jgi:hypothetical protein